MERALRSEADRARRRRDVGHAVGERLERLDLDARAAPLGVDDHVAPVVEVRGRRHPTDHLRVAVFHQRGGDELVEARADRAADDQPRFRTQRRVGRQELHELRHVLLVDPVARAEVADADRCLGCRGRRPLVLIEQRPGDDDLGRVLAHLAEVLGFLVLHRHDIVGPRAGEPLARLVDADPRRLGVALLEQRAVAVHEVVVRDQHLARVRGDAVEHGRHERVVRQRDVVLEPVHQLAHALERLDAAPVVHVQVQPVVVAPDEPRRNGDLFVQLVLPQRRPPLLGRGVLQVVGVVRDVDVVPRVLEIVEPQPHQRRVALVLLGLERREEQGVLGRFQLAAGRLRQPVAQPRRGQRARRRVPAHPHIGVLLFDREPLAPLVVGQEGHAVGDAEPVDVVPHAVDLVGLPLAGQHQACVLAALHQLAERPEQLADRIPIDPDRHVGGDQAGACGRRVSVHLHPSVARRRVSPPAGPAGGWTARARFTTARPVVDRVRPAHAGGRSRRPIAARSVPSSGPAHLASTDQCP